MIDRRALMIAGLGVAALGAAEALRPRKRLVLLQGVTIDKALPRSFGAWQSEVTEGLITPEMAGRLANSLYSEMVSRIYYEQETGAGVMMLIAYGDTQSDLLQLHRPESCYPAVGFTLRSAESALVPLPSGEQLPARKVVAATEERVENILYWTRIGEALPQTGSQQRTVRINNAMQGYVADGILVRCSAVGEPAESFKILDRFVPDMLQAIPAPHRRAFVGTRLAARIT